MIYVVVDCEGVKPGGLYVREFGAVPVHISPPSVGDVYFRGDNSRASFEAFALWLRGLGDDVKFVSDNPAYDWQPINYLFHLYLGRNPFGHSARRIGDFYAGLTGSWHETQGWKRLRVTKHDHDPVNDARGNAEALVRLLKGER